MDEEGEEYKFNKFVGFVSLEQNYYLNLDAKMVDSEVKWGEWKSSDNKTSSSSSSTSSSPSPYETLFKDADNEKANECLKKNFYPTLTQGSGSTDTTIYLDISMKGSEFHTYSIYGDDATVTYTAKWF